MQSSIAVTSPAAKRSKCHSSSTVERLIIRATSRNRRGGGISRKITNLSDRKKLKEIANEIDVPLGAGLIVRTAGAKRTKIEIKRDYEYLQRLWEQIRELTLKSIAPSKIYEEGDLIKRSISCLLYTSPSPRDKRQSRMPSSA